MFAFEFCVRFSCCDWTKVIHFEHHGSVHEFDLMGMYTTFSTLLLLVYVLFEQPLPSNIDNTDICSTSTIAVSPKPADNAGECDHRGHILNNSIERDEDACSLCQPGPPVEVCQTLLHA